MNFFHDVQPSFYIGENPHRRELEGLLKSINKN